MGNRFCYEARKRKQSRLPLFFQMSGTKCRDGQSPQKMTEFARRCRPDRDTGRGAFGDFTAAQQYARYETGKQELPMHQLIELAALYAVSIDDPAGVSNTPTRLP